MEGSSAPASAPAWASDAYAATTYGVAVFWLPHLLAPRHKWSRALREWQVGPAVLATMYTVLLLLRTGGSLGAPTGGDMLSLAGVMEIFRSPEVVLFGWIHYLSFDLATGHWITNDALARGVPRWLFTACLPLTYLFGPAGLLLYLICRFAYGRGRVPARIDGGSDDGGSARGAGDPMSSEAREPLTGGNPLAGSPSGRADSGGSRRAAQHGGDGDEDDVDDDESVGGSGGGSRSERGRSTGAVATRQAGRGRPRRSASRGRTIDSVGTTSSTGTDGATQAKAAGTVGFRTGFGLHSYLAPLPLLGIGAAFATWYSVTSPAQKVMGVFAATAYSAIEFTWYSLSTEDPVTGEVAFAPWETKNRRKGFTTIEQWWANVLYTPVLLDVYAQVLPDSTLLRVLLFPLNAWLLEIVEGYALMAMFGLNPAWTYTGDDAFFHGNIKMAHWHLWIGLGLLVELVFRTYIHPTLPGIAASLNVLM